MLTHALYNTTGASACECGDGVGREGRDMTCECGDGVGREGRDMTLMLTVTHALYNTTGASACECGGGVCGTKPLWSLCSQPRVRLSTIRSRYIYRYMFVYCNLRNVSYFELLCLERIERNRKTILKVKSKPTLVRGHLHSCLLTVPSVQFYITFSRSSI